MPTKKKKPTKDRLRERAEKLLSENPETFSKVEPKDFRKLVHELQVHQVELEMQNQELRNAQAVIEESRAKYSELYDFAPAGYFTLTSGALIEEVNLTGACLLNIERTKLIRRPFSAFVESSFQRVFMDHFMKSLKQGVEANCAIEMLRRGQGTFHAFVNSISANYGSTTRVRTIVTDITERKRAEEHIRRLNKELEERNLNLKDSEGRLRFLSSKLINIQEAERRRIATEVHDSLGQSLNAIKFRFQETIRQLEEEEKGRTTVGKQLRDLIIVVQAAIDDARRIQMELRPPVLDDLGIGPTLSWFCREFQKTYKGIKVDWQVKIDESKLPTSLEAAAFRILQEAMNNVAKHSDASHISLSLTKKENTLEMVIEDNGHGFDLDKALSNKDGSRGLGLASMQERADLSGGRFLIESAMEKGTTVRVTWPLERDAVPQGENL